MAEDEKPFGWRPYSEEYRASLREWGLDEEQIAKQEATNEYTPDKVAVAGYELARSILVTLAERLGPDFAADVRTTLRDRAGLYAASDQVEDRVDSKAMNELADAPFWERPPLTPVIAS